MIDGWEFFSLRSKNIVFDFIFFFFSPFHRWSLEREQAFIMKKCANLLIYSHLSTDGMTKDFESFANYRFFVVWGERVKNEACDLWIVDVFYMAVR